MIPKLQRPHSNHERRRLSFHFICTFFTYFLTFFKTSQSQPRVEAMAETFFLPFFQVIFKMAPWFCMAVETFFRIYRIFFYHGRLASYNNGILYQTVMFWRKYCYFSFKDKKQIKGNIFISYTLGFPTMGTINSLHSRDQKISCQSWCYK